MTLFWPRGNLQVPVITCDLEPLQKQQPLRRSEITKHGCGNGCGNVRNRPCAACIAAEKAGVREEREAAAQRKKKEIEDELAKIAGGCAAIQADLAKAARRTQRLSAACKSLARAP
mmetsp:Transcript_98815/g.175998  ORF Transcript_98815/g.175998 Transcript_98815/m.175998 type:complete len:116 (-) Transcript_98815:63-410(-)|eukprot:CAMPEP_0197661928 /NCGR_PEP_ID=MMETSP1338-20131121/51756_1 /TAXON_ID=43686 ORGANISM="Pelagodinium beii, Strain RCC1491" /NCGR_SAMPLE_ID=MMETSP1338 /ASSEMBLY_ACC=CAM_ASM_000754 /LENGTH=115 /DNA_ID=CAMNT_0043239579 /DNA_START=1 /DNA_END=348 /DNA_ORIENTATION=-